jgi:hypothetical protein
MIVVPSASAISQLRSTVSGRAQVAYVATPRPWRASAASAASTCESVAQSGCRCAPQTSTVSKPSARASASTASMRSAYVASGANASCVVRSPCAQSSMAKPASRPT